MGQITSSRAGQEIRDRSSLKKVLKVRKDNFGPTDFYVPHVIN